MTIDLRIVALDTPAPFPDLRPTDLTTEFMRVVILERGTAMGKTSVMFIFGDQGQHCLQLTAGELLTIAGAVRGAVQRFEGK